MSKDCCGHTRLPVLSVAPSRTVKDPVCGMDVQPARASAQHEHDGTTYWFCNPTCLARFRQDPARYLTPPAP